MQSSGASHKYKFCEGGGGPVGICLPGGNGRGACMGVTAHMYHQNGINGKLKKAPKAPPSDGRRKLSCSAPADPPADAAPARVESGKPRTAVLYYDGAGGRAKLKLTLPASWASKPASKLAAAIAKAANAKPGGVKIAPECLALFAGDGAPIPPDAPIGGLPDGAAVRARDAPVPPG